MYARDDHEAEIWVPLAQIRISTRRRRGLSSATVERYREWLEQGREAPPVRLARDGDGFVVRDGRHRVAASLAAGHAVVKAELRRIAGWFGWRQAPLGSPAPTHLGDVAPVAERLACTEEVRVRLPPSPLHASVVSTASTRPLYGRGAGSIPAGGSLHARSSEDRAPLCDGGGRWFESSRAYHVRT